MWAPRYAPVSALVITICANAGWDRATIRVQKVGPGRADAVGFMACGPSDLEVSKDAVAGRHHFHDVGSDLGVGWHAALFAHRFRPGFVGGKSQIEAVERGHRLKQTARATVEVLERVSGGDAQVIGGFASWM